jgi:tripartite-type tricarboxylate transporter receptor subunit TctC
MMEPSRRTFLRSVARAAGLSPISVVAMAQSYPARPVRLIVPFPPGGGSDIVGRLMGEWLSDRLGQPLIIENRPGAGSNLGTEAVVKAAPDGYTLLVVGSPNAINATLYERVNYDFIRDIAAVASAFRAPLVMEVNASFPARTVSEFIAYARTNPGRINMASNGTGTPSHVAGELFKAMAGVDMVHVPYRGAALALPDIFGGQVQVMFDSLASSLPHIRAGRLRALTVTTTTRSETLPQVPALGEFLPGYEASTWNGLGAPKDTPTEIIKKLNREVNGALADPKVKARLADLGGTAFANSPADFGAFIAEETEKWAKVIRFAGIKPG